jgi:ATP synthase F1 epsilon subunit
MASHPRNRHPGSPGLFRHHRHRRHPDGHGEIGILPGHIPLLTQVEHGELRVTKGTATSFLAVGGGFAQIDGDRVRVLAEHAITEEKIDENAVEAALKKAEQELPPPRTWILSNTNTSRASCATPASNSPSNAAAANFSPWAKPPRWFDPGLFSASVLILGLSFNAHLTHPAFSPLPVARRQHGAGV